MGFFRNSRSLAAAFALCAVAEAVSALTLGRARGVALIGRPLTVTVPVNLEDSEGACAEAELFQGDTRIDAGRTNVTVEPGSGGDVTVRIVTSAVIEEPVVTMYLRAGCGTQRVTRRYVLLSEPPDPLSEGRSQVALPTVPVAPPVPVAAASQPRSAAARPARPQGAAQRAPTSGAAGEGGATASAPAAAPATPRPARPPFRAVKPAPAPAATAGQRLKLEPLDLSIDTAPTLRSSGQLDTVPTEDLQRRAQAAALWQALNASPEDLLRSAQRIDALEKEMRGVRQQVQQGTAAMEQMRGQVEKARAERNLASALAVLLAAALLGALGFVLWRRRRPQRHWWRASQLPEESGFHPPSVAPGRQPAAAAPSPATGVPSTVVAGPSTELDLNFSESALDRIQSSPVSRPPEPFRRSRNGSGFRPSRGTDFQNSLPATLRMVKAEELIDIQQQADFFVSLGQYSHAAEVLENHLRNNVETSALPWLDLLDIYHRMQRREEYEALRAEFEHRFNAGIPAFDAYSERSGGLENYERALSRIVELWPSRRVLEVIDESIFRKPGVAGAEPFDLEAYRELVLLYNVARDIVDEDEDLEAPPVDSRPSGSGFSETNLQPLSASLPPVRSPAAPALSAASAADEPTLALSPMQVPWASPRLGLDIDLDELEPPPAEDDMLDFDFDLVVDPPPEDKDKP